MHLKIDKSRWRIKESLLSDSGTGIFVRAQTPRKDGGFGYQWDSVDIVLLDWKSLQTWLRSRGGINPWAENIVGVMLGHDMQAVEESQEPEIWKLLFEEIEKKAREVDDHLQNACGDLGYEYEKHPDLMGMGDDDKWEAKIKQAKKDGVQDISGWLADEMYDDVDSLCDMSGDQISDMASDYRIRVLIQILIAMTLKGARNGDSSLSKAMDNHIKGWTLWLKK